VYLEVKNGKEHYVIKVGSSAVVVQSSSGINLSLRNLRLSPPGWLQNGVGMMTISANLRGINSAGPPSSSCQGGNGTIIEQFQYLLPLPYLWHHIQREGHQSGASKLLVAYYIQYGLHNMVIVYLIFTIDIYYRAVKGGPSSCLFLPGRFRDPNHTSPV
jgi:hypothetical protein